MKTLTKIILMILPLLLFTVPTNAQETLWNELNTRATTLYQQGQYSEAASVAKEALEIAEKTFDPNHPSVATSLNNLAALYGAQGKYAEGRAALQAITGNMGKGTRARPSRCGNCVGEHGRILQEDWKGCRSEEIRRTCKKNSFKK